MDLMAYVQIDGLAGYVERHYGRPPRLRGLRLMRVEREFTPPTPTPQLDLFNGFVGQDVVYVHTRCGAYGDEGNPRRNYRSFGADEWERSNPDTFITSVDDEYDPTYRDHYFRAVVDDEYEALLESLAEAGDGDDRA